MNAVSLSRRRFSELAFASSAAALASAAGGPALQAIEPIARTGSARFKFSLAAYSYRKLLTENKLTLSDFVADCARFGLHGTELTSYYFPDPPGPDYLRRLKQECFQAGLDVSGTAVGNEFCHPEGDARRKQIESVKRWIEHAEVLGAPVIRIFSGNTKQGSTPEQAHALAVAGIEECCAYAGRHGVHLALENHGGLTAQADDMLRLVRDVNSPWFGVNMDTGNFHSHDVYRDLEKIAPYALNVQVKVATRGADRKRQPTDFARLAEILQQTGYQGYIVLEYEEAGDPRTECPKFLDQLRQAFA